MHCFKVLELYLTIIHLNLFKREAKYNYKIIKFLKILYFLFLIYFFSATISIKIKS